MNVTEFKTAISAKFQCSNKDADTIYKNIVSIISDTLVSGESVELQGIGTFKLSERKERNGVNPSTKEKIVIPASKSVSFKTSSTIKKRLNS